MVENYESKVSNENYENQSEDYNSNEVPDLSNINDNEFAIIETNITAGAEKLSNIFSCNNLGSIFYCLSALSILYGIISIISPIIQESDQLSKHFHALV